MKPSWVDITAETGPNTASTMLREGERGRIVRDSMRVIIKTTTDPRNQ